jgi:hypothetical protein
VICPLPITHLPMAAPFDRSNMMFPVVGKKECKIVGKKECKKEG